MKKRALGNTGMKASEIAFGGVEIGMPYGIGIQSESDMPTITEAIKLLHSALDLGVNFFDTARLYGKSEEIMGLAFKDKRDQVLLETKCKHLLDKDKKLPSTNSIHRIIEESLQESLEALQTDYIDVFMLHDASPDLIDNEQIISAFAALKKSGMIRATGISTYTPEETSLVIENGAWDVIQVPFNLMDQRQKDFFPLAKAKGIGIVIRSVLLKGLLSDRGKDLHPALHDVEAHIRLYDQLLSESIPDLPTLATKFALSFEEVSSILVGIDRLDYLYRSVETANNKVLSESSINKASLLAYPDPAFLNLHHWDINGWLK